MTYPNYQESVAKLEDLPLEERVLFIESGLAKKIPVIIEEISCEMNQQGFSSQFYVAYMQYLIERTGEKFLF